MRQRGYVGRVGIEMLENSDVRVAMDDGVVILICRVVLIASSIIMLGVSLAPVSPQTVSARRAVLTHQNLCWMISKVILLGGVSEP